MFDYQNATILVYLHDPGDNCFMFKILDVIYVKQGRIIRFKSRQGININILINMSMVT